MIDLIGGLVVTERPAVVLLSGGLGSTTVLAIESAAKAYGATATAARAALNQLQSAGLLQPTRVGRRRDREWTSDELFQLLDAFEYNLGEPEVVGRCRPAASPTRRQVTEPGCSTFLWGAVAPQSSVRCRRHAQGRSVPSPEVASTTAINPLTARS